MSTTTTELPKRKREIIDKAVIRFCGDSGDGMQITGSQFTNTVALYGNDLATFPDYPGRNSRPCRDAARRQRIPGAIFVERRLYARRCGGRADGDESRRAEDECRRPETQRDSDRQYATASSENDLRKAQMTSNPLEDHSLDGYRLFPVELDEADARGAARIWASTRRAWTAARISSRWECATGFTTGSMDPTLRWLEDKFKKQAAAGPKRTSWP